MEYFRVFLEGLREQIQARYSVSMSRLQTSTSLIQVTNMNTRTDFRSKKYDKFVFIRQGVSELGSLPN